jgi:1,4-alpha-glucan branching enzyme
VHIVRVRHLFYPDMPRDYFYELSARQVEMGHEVNVLTWNRNGKCSEERMVEGFIVYRLPGLNFCIPGIIQEYPYLPGLPAKVERLKSEIVHAESHLFLTTVQAVRKAKKLNLPSVVTVHGVFAERGVAVNFAQYAYLRTLGLEVFRSANRVICLTQGDVEEIVRFGCPLEKIRLVPNAVDTEVFKPCKEREDNLVVWVGRFVPEKGLECLVEAAKIVADEFRNVKFLLVGYGPLKAKIMKLVYDRGLLGRFVRFTGPLSRDDVAKVLGKAAVFVFPSLKEGLPLSVLEAMACGVPVVGSDIPGVKDVIKHGENGFLAPPKNPKALADGILALLNDRKLRMRLGKGARELMLENYSWNIVTNRLETVYQEVNQG